MSENNTIYSEMTRDSVPIKEYATIQSSPSDLPPSDQLVLLKNNKNISNNNKYILTFNAVDGILVSTQMVGITKYIMP